MARFNGAVRGYKGRYVPQFPEKYIGNSNNIIFRSLAERKMMRYLDITSEVVRWASEEIAIPYQSSVDSKIHNYYPDFYAEICKTDDIKKYLIEIKPKFQTEPPKNKKSVHYLTEVKTYMVNNDKWNAAEEFCKKNNMEFIIITV